MPDDTEAEKATTLAAEIRAETAALNQLLSAYASKAEVSRQLDDERAKTKQLIAEKSRWRTLAVGAVAFLALFAIGVGGLALSTARRVSDQAAQVAAQTRDRRVADCKSYDDLANAIKQGNIGSISVLLDPQFSGPNADPARLQQFIDAFAAGGSAGVDKAIVQARAKKGYSADCTQIGTPPKPGG